ncbi:MAG TPA: hypothetical protein ENN38_02270 [Actinobacteria bacterium]|nr:hypothetical protein [Actinomycetota bacterium]
MDINAIQQQYEAGFTAPVTKKGELGKDEFLLLLVTQMRYQDPLEPVKDTEFISQLAQFNSLEQMQKLNQGFESMHKWLQIAQSSGMINKEIEAIDFNSGKIVRGVVTEVRFKDGQPWLLVGNNEISPVDVLRIIGEGDESDG